jgi:hypothetical protein
MLPLAVFGDCGERFKARLKGSLISQRLMLSDSVV